MIFKKIFSGLSYRPFVPMVGKKVSTLLKFNSSDKNSYTGWKDQIDELIKRKLRSINKFGYI